MTQKEEREYRRLSILWATGRASMNQMMRCLDLHRKREYELRAAKAIGR